MLRIARKYIKNRRVKKLLKFSIVGFSAAMVSLLVFWITNMSFPQYNLFAKAFGYIIGFFVGFSLNKLWTYVDHTEDGEKYLLRYTFVYIATFFVYLAFNYTCDHILRLHQPFYWVLEFLNLTELTQLAYQHDTTVSNITSIGLNAVLNFLGTNYLVFKNRSLKK